VRLAGARSWRSLPALYRDNAVFLTASAAQGREQAASGARVIGPAGSGTGEGAVRAELDAARQAAPLTAAETRVRLRDIFLTDATAARLTAVAAAAELPATLVSGRQIGALAFLADASAAARVAAALLAQRLRPAELVAACPPGQAAAVHDAAAPLAAAGIRVEVIDAPGGTLPDVADTERLRPLARLATASWLAPWAADGGQDAEYLLDLACARECGQADAVGFGGREYEFIRWLSEPALVRASLLHPGGPAPADWGSHGLRLLSVTAGPEAVR
jgi:hypothetical protein